MNDKIEKFKPTVKLKAVFKSNQLKNSITVVKESNAKDKKNTNAFYQKNSNKKSYFSQNFEKLISQNDESLYKNYIDPRKKPDLEKDIKDNFTSLAGYTGKEIHDLIKHIREIGKIAKVKSIYKVNFDKKRIKKA
ncbi:hypothetical protein NPX79_03460 [Spiroplasma endosymbiont of Anurida maritima]|uniref:hypothetical protein n=1 Tax=Spiroplasma endosymbiont of Anurida maritima TaxID=2967972 RepID=UPI0036D285D0